MSWAKGSSLEWAIGGVSIKAAAAANSAPTNLLATTTTNGGLSINEDGGNDAYFIADDGEAILGGLTALTTEVQFSMDSFGGTQYFTSYETSNQPDCIRIGIHGGGEIRLFIDGTRVDSTAMDYRTLADGEQHTLSVTWDNSGGLWEIFVDGVSVDSGSGLKDGASISTGSGTLVYGNEQDGVDTGYDTFSVLSATVYDIRIFDDVRSSLEIAANYDSTLPYDEANMVANWTFGEMSVDGVVTEKVSGNNLTLKHASGAGFIASNPELTLAVQENAVNGTVVGSVSGTDAERDAKIAALLAADPDLYYNAETGKFYQAVSGWHTPAEARTNAESALLNGVNGQLVTIRSAAENEFVRVLANPLGNRIWIGATDATVEGEWRWIESGSEADQFWSGLEDGNAVNGAYQSWDPGLQPNQSGGEEDWAEMDPATGLWWDNKVDVTSHFVTEWDADDVLDATDPLTYSIESQTVLGAFAIDADSGLITVADGSLLDYETNPTHSVTIRVTDVGGLTYDEPVNITLNDVKDAVSNNVPGAQSTNEDVALIFNTANGNLISITADAGEVLTTTVSVSQGTLNLSQTTGLTFDAGSNGTATMTVTGTVEDINAALDGLQYTPRTDFNGGDTLTLTSRDAELYSLEIDSDLLGRYQFEGGRAR